MVKFTKLNCRKFYDLSEYTPRVNFEIGNKSNLGFFLFLSLTLRAFFERFKKSIESDTPWENLTPIVQDRKLLNLFFCRLGYISLYKGLYRNNLGIKFYFDVKNIFLITIFLDNIFCYPHDNKTGGDQFDNKICYQLITKPGRPERNRKQDSREKM
ncbi:hypothetical protein BpHYR1_045845 [Brachionus plicatilis]|uniref:Uncharacterized protein n=1 Tax=Brachionus plicatilis TaxID=10195 RepID=A0A3M7QTM5_BRAPC|nr:hypothetical protein BpHYR1_045845 [Brachionus plicatilis]